MVNKYILAFKEAVRKLEEEYPTNNNSSFNDYKDQDITHDPELLKKAWDVCSEYIKNVKDMNYINSFDIDVKIWYANNGFEFYMNRICDSLYNNFTSPKEQEFLEQWTAGDGIIGLVDYIWKHKNEFI